MSAVSPDALRLPDAYWSAACDAALAALREAEHVLVPNEFLLADRRFAPLEFSWGMEPAQTALAWCCSKDDVDRIAPWLLAAATEEPFYAWANEVFVLGANFRWRNRADANSRRHLRAWFDRVARYRRGIPARPGRERPAGDGEGSDKRVLIVGASAMGNVGDDLLGEVIAELVADTGARAFLSGPDIDPLRVASYDAVIVGGGGLLYASRAGADERQNLGNYLKFGPMGRHFGKPTALIGVGDQDHASGITSDPLTLSFARTALRTFDKVTTRDDDTATLIASLAESASSTGADLLFHWAQRARAAVKPSTLPARRVALIGELYRIPALASALEALFDAEGRPTSTLSRSALNGDLELVVMSNDDVPHCERFQKALRKAGASASIVDARHRDLEALVFLFGSYAAVGTTRFHGYVLAALAGVPALGFDVPSGKLARLARDLDRADTVVTDGELPRVRQRMDEALDGSLAPIAASSVDEFARRSHTHRAAIEALLGSSSTPRPRVQRRGFRTRAAFQGLPEDPSEPIPLCWAASSGRTQGYANLGDSLSAVIVAALSGRPVKHTSFESAKTKLVAVGSIGHAIRNGVAVVWGSGVSIRGGTLAQNVPFTQYDIRAVRGPISARHYRDFSLDVPDVYGDPVWFLPSIVSEPVEKKYELGVIPHIMDVSGYRPDAPPRPDSLRYVVDGDDAGSVVVINTWHEPTWEGILEKLRAIRACKRIVSQSFHGVVIAEAYGIPVLNFRYQIGARNGLQRISLLDACSTDPRVWEFYAGGARKHYYMYSQRREQRTDWEKVVRAIDEAWEPVEYRPEALVHAFPLPLAFDPLTEQTASVEKLRALVL